MLFRSGLVANNRKEIKMITPKEPLIRICDLLEILRILHELNNECLTEQVAIYLAYLNNPPLIAERKQNNELPT